MKSDNELIAEFMGQHITMVGLRRNVMQKSYYANELQYHSSWDWLMPVVQKINRMDKMVTINYYTDAHVTVTKIYSWNLGDNVHEDEFEEEKAIDSVYKAVVNFIKWYNNQQPKP